MPCIISSVIAYEVAKAMGIQGVRFLFCVTIKKTSVALHKLVANPYLRAVVCAVSFMMSGNFSLYKSQKIMFSKQQMKE